MTDKLWNHAIALVTALSIATPVNAQPGGSQDHAMSGMDMQAMRDQCAQMRGQMQPGSRMSPDMQAVMRRCDDMDAQTDGTRGNPTPRPRTR
jgi:hypothetical protein